MNQKGKDSKPQEKPPASPYNSENVPSWRSFLNQHVDQFLGFIGWYILNSMMWILFGARPGEELGQEGLMIFYVYPVHFLALFFLFGIKDTRKFAYGAILAVALNFLLSLLMGLITNAICFVPFIFPDQ